MEIINPLYDIAFKYLMQEEPYAKKVLSVILDTEVVSVSLNQQESVLQKLRDYARLLKESGGAVHDILEKTGLSENEIGKV